MVGGSTDNGAYVFVSYSRADADYVARLVEHLRSAGVSVWYDQQLPNGVRWRETLAERVEHAAAVLLVESGSAQASDWVNEEFLYARKKGRPLLVVVIDGDLRFGLQGVNAQFVVDGALPGAAFVERARELVTEARVCAPGDVATRVAEVIAAEAWDYPPVPAGMVARPAQTEAIVAALTSGSGTVGVTGLYGGGGFGKTIVARMVCARPEVREAFPGGLLWVELGQDRRGGALAATIDEMCVRLGGAPSRASEPMAAGRSFAALLAARPSTLVVVDDVWYQDQLAPFLDVDGGSARHLVTTRIASLLSEEATAIRLDQLDDAQARTVLLDGLVGLGEPTEARLLHLTGGWALAVKAANSALRRAQREGHDLAATAAWLADTLTAEGPDVLDLGQERSRRKTIAATLQASLRLLDDAQRERYLELGIFAEDTDIDFGMLSLLWGATGGLSLRDARRLVADLAEQSLVTDFRPETGTIRLHDVVRAYLREQLGSNGVRTAHKALLSASVAHFGLPVAGRGGSNPTTSAWWVLPDSADYLWRHLVEHLAAAGLQRELRGLVEDLRWGAAKLAQFGPAALDADLAHVSGSVVLALRRALRLEGYLLGWITPAHSYADVIAARFDADADLHAPVTKFRAAQPGNVVRLRPGLELPDTPDSAVLRVLAGHTGPVRSVAIAQDGTWLATASDDLTALVWDAATGDLRTRLTGHTGPLRSVAIAPDGAWLATASSDRTVRMWDMAIGSLRATLTGHTGAVRSVAIASDGTWLATTSDDRTVRVWDAATGHLRTTLSGHTGSVNSVAIAPDGVWLVSASNDLTVRVWDSATGQLRTTLAGHSGPVMSVAIASDGAWLATASSDRTARVWDAATGRLRNVLTGHASPVRSVAIASDGTWLATGGGDRTVRVWDAAIGARHATLTGRTGSIYSVASAPDGTWLVTANSDRTVRVWNPANGGLRATLTGHSKPVMSVAVSPDGAWVATASIDRTVRVWDAGTGRLRTTLSGHTDSVYSVAIAPDGAWLATASDDKTVRVWDTATGTRRIALTGHSKPVMCVAIAPDGAWLATGGFDRTVRLWDAATGTRQATLIGHTGPVRSVSIAPDGAWLATASDDKTIRVWDAATRKHITLTGHTGSVYSVAIAPNGVWLATASDDKTVRVWDAATGANIATMRVAGPLSSTAWAPTGRSLYAAGQFGLYRFDLNAQRPATLKQTALRSKQTANGL